MRSIDVWMRSAPAARVAKVAGSATAASVVVQLSENESSLMSVHDASHPLDYPIWTALTTTQQALAEGDARARRYPTEITPFAAMRGHVAPKVLRRLAR